MSPSSPACEGFSGNPDLYGLGIRCGVYLQWVSTWLSISFDPKSAQETHDANSIFVFALLIGVIQAASSNTIRPVEAFLMLQICYGYFFTVLGLFGLRLQLLGYARTWKFCKAWRACVQQMGQDFREQIKAIEERLESSKGFRQVLSSSYVVTTAAIPLKNVSFLKDRHLTWAGVFWRSTISAMFASCTIWFWFSGLKTPTYSSESSTACIPVVFMCSKLLMTRPVIIFYRVATVFGAVPVFYLFAFLLLVCFKLIMCFFISLARQVLATSVKAIYPGKFEKVIKLMVEYNETIGSFNQAGLSFLANYVPPLGDVLEMIAVVASAKESSEPVVIRDKTNKYWSVFIKTITIGVHIWTALAITWFILSTELMISWNQISEVNTFNTTGQLIPFIIGITSAARTIQRIVLAILKEVYSDWSKVDLDVRWYSNGSVTLERKISHGSQAGNEQPLQSVGDENGVVNANSA